MGMDLQTAIQEAIAVLNGPYPLVVFVVVTMHDEEGRVLSGSCAPGFFSNTVGMFRVLSQGFTTVNNPPTPGSSNQLLDINTNQAIPLEFTVTRRTLAFLGGGLLSSSIQLNLATFNAAGQVSSRAVFYVTQNGALLRGVGASLMNPGKQASYTVTLDAVPLLP